MANEEVWKELNKAWQEALSARMSVESIIDAQVKLHFEKGGPGPTKALQDWLLELRQDESEARGRLDHFIHEHFG